MFALASIVLPLAAVAAGSRARAAAKKSRKSVFA
jgi:hypothetical protein